MIQMPTKKKYDSLREELDTPVFVVCDIGSAEQTFIDDVRASWYKHAEECPDSILSDVMKKIGYANSVEGLIDLYGHQIPPYSFFDSERNKREAIIAVTLAVIAPITVDGCIYHKDGFAYLRLNNQAVECFEDTSDGVKYTLYFKKK